MTLIFTLQEYDASLVFLYDPIHMIISIVELKIFLLNNLIVNIKMND